MKYVLAVAMPLLLTGVVAAQTAPINLPATPSTVVWGYYSAKAKPVLTIHSGDTVHIQTLSTCGPTERLEEEGVAAADIPPYNADIYRDVKDKGPGGHILTGPVDIAEAEPGDVLEVQILKIDRDTFTTNTANRKDPPLFGPGTSLFRYSDSNLKHPTSEFQARKPITPRAAYRERDDRTSTGLPPGNHQRGASLAPSCEDYVNVVPALRAGHPRGLNLTRRTVSAPTTVADLIGDLAALHQHFVKGRVVGSGFCHSE